jgi:hypothetical protein
MLHGMFQMPLFGVTYKSRPSKEKFVASAPITTLDSAPIPRARSITIIQMSFLLRKATRLCMTDGSLRVWCRIPVNVM